MKDEFVLDDTIYFLKKYKDKSRNYSEVLTKTLGILRNKHKLDITEDKLREMVER